METSKTSTQLSFASLSSVPEDIRASLFPQPGSEEARRTTVTSGLRCSELYKSAGRLGCLQKMLLVTSRWVSTKCFLTWKDKTTPANRLLFQLVPKMPVTDEIESGLWRTPMNCDYKNMTYAKQEYLSDQVKMWPTPLASDHRGSAGMGKKELPNIVKMWPTPSATPRGAHTGERAGQVNENGKTRTSAKGIKFGATLQTAVGSGSLNPTWVEWLMGYPLGWTDLKD